MQLDWGKQFLLLRNAFLLLNMECQVTFAPASIYLFFSLNDAVVLSTTLFIVRISSEYELEKIWKRTAVYWLEVLRYCPERCQTAWEKHGWPQNIRTPSQKFNSVLFAWEVGMLLLCHNVWIIQSRQACVHNSIETYIKCVISWPLRWDRWVVPKRQ